MAAYPMSQQFSVDRLAIVPASAEADWNQAFNFSSNVEFLSSCIQKTKGDVTQALVYSSRNEIHLPTTSRKTKPYLWGANIWADVGSSSEVFCSAGSYCPTTVKRIPCSSGHYCRMGSTSEKRCFALTSCNPSTANQNMHAYGIMLIAALSTLLLIIYNCSDQVLTTRGRRLAKSREAAARSARETAKAQQRWKSAKDAAKKHASGLQAHLSRTFSRKKDTPDPEKLKILNQSKPDIDDGLPIPPHPSTSGVSLSSPVPSEGKKKEPSELMQIMRKIEEDPDCYEGFSIGAEDTNVGNVPKGKQINTHSQIFKYAYAQLEKEKAQQQEYKDLTSQGWLKWLLIMK
ncbi:ABC transporter G family member 24-like [Prunus yedoensis var. nudiflora]|uniref:ABC transporter G family member 24-like n=1 Tax=Prunus yedoensis var. nudiflora TaxID=2094558 RepID=A0A314Y877_PRUYE|nr:ABC transporter G family member 24-like [Prunus yedoensis var. nudiflora]